MKQETSRLYRCIKAAVRLCYPRMTVTGAENLPDGPAVIVGNHAQMHGPIAGELYLPGDHVTWCAGEMMDRKTVPDYAFQDFWSRKPRSVRWFYRLLSHLIAPLSACVFNNANTVAVYRDSRIVATFKETVKRLQEGYRVVIFPEHDEPYNHILCRFQERFVDVARLYFKRTGQELSFVPMYLAPKRKTICLGKPISFRADAPPEEERQRICGLLMEEITAMACAMPKHTVIPYNNIPKKEYGTNVPGEAVYG